MKKRMIFSLLIIGVFILSSFILPPVEAAAHQDIDTGTVAPPNPDDQDNINFSATGNGDPSTITITVYYRKSTTSTWSFRNLNLFGDCFLDPDLGPICDWAGASSVGSLPAGIYYYYFSGASDREPNTGSKSFVVTSSGDTTPPVIDSFWISPTNPSQSNSVKVYADVRDTSSIQVVDVEWISSVGNGRQGMINTIDTVYEYSSIPNYPAKTIVNYRIHAKDSWGNIKISAWQNYEVADTEPPKIENVRLIPSVPNDEISTIVEALVTDTANSVISVRIRVFEGGALRGNFNMIRIGSRYQYNFGMASIGTIFNYNIIATDSVGNVANYISTSFQITPGTPPTIILQSIDPIVPAESQDVTVSASIFDGSGINIVTAIYGTKASESINIVLTQNGAIWSGTIPGQAYGTLVTYTFTAIDNSGQQNSATSSYLISDNDGPTIENIIHEPTIPKPNEEISVTTSISDTNGISNVILEYSNDGGLSYTNITMTIDPVLGIPYYNASFPGASDWNINIFYRIFASDGVGNWAMTTLAQIIISDTTAPNVTSVSHTPTNPSNISIVTVTGIVTDSGSGVDVVLLIYTFDNTTWISIEMSGSLSLYSAEIPNKPWNSYIEYRIEANDSLGNTILSSVESYRIEDNASPSITSISQNPVSPYNDTDVKITAEINDDVAGVDFAQLYYTINNRTWIIIPMVNVSSTFSADIPAQDWYTVVTYKIVALDILGNLANSINKTYSIQDLTAPNISVLTITDDLTPNDDIIFRIRVTDSGSGIKLVLLYYKIDNNNYIFVEMIVENFDNFIFNISPQPWGTQLEYYFYTEDNSGNNFNTVLNTIIVQDIIAPIINNIQIAPEPPTNFDNVVISASVTDDKTDIQSTILFYSVDKQQTWNVLVMTNSGLSAYNGTIPNQPWDTDVYYFIEAVDIFGNGRNSSINLYTVVDVFQPIIQSVERQPFGVEDSVDVLVNASTFDEGSGIDFVELHYQIDSAGWNVVLMSYSSGFSYTHFLPSQISNTLVEYFIRSYDNLGNFETSTTYSYLVGDSISPILSSIQRSPATPYEEDNVEIVTTIVDYGSGVETAYIVYSINNGSDWTFITMITYGDDIYTGIIQKQIWNTTVLYYIRAIDYLGNTKNSGIDQYVVKEAGFPTITNIILSPKAPKSNDDVQFWAIISDSKSGISYVRLEYSYVSGGSGFVLMTLIGRNNYTGIIPAANADTKVYYQIRAYDNDGNFRYLGGNYVTADVRAPNIISISLLETPHNNESTAVAIAVIDYESYVTSLRVYYSLDNETWYYESYQSGDYKDIYYGKFVLIPSQNYTDVVYYYVRVIDAYGNVAVSSTMSYFVEDGTPADIIELTRTPEQPQYQDSLLIEIEVVDVDTGINSVEIFYMFNNSEIWNSSMMIQGIEGNYSYIFEPQAYGANLFYYVLIIDKSSLQVETRSLMKSVLYIDYSGPSITDISQFPINGVISNNDTVVIQASIIDSQSVYSATIQYYANGEYNEISMQRGSGDLWFIEFDSYPVGTNVTYRIYAIDNPRCYVDWDTFAYICPRKNGGYSQFQTYIVTLDELPPEISNFRHTPEDNISNDDTIQFFIDIEDIGAGVNYYSLYLDTDSYPLTQVNGTTYKAIISGLIYGHNYTVSFFAEDYNRYKSAAIYYIKVTRDGISPTITSIVISNIPVYEASNAIVNATITDRGSGVQSATLFYSTNGSSTWFSLTMTYTGSNFYYAIMPFFSWDWTVSYYIVSVDNFDNNSTSSVKSFHILEDDVPLLLQVSHYPILPSNRDTIVIIVSASDDKSGIASVSIFVNISESEFVSLPYSFNGTHYILNLGYIDYQTSVFYFVSIVDFDGNEAISDVNKFVVIDKINPILYSVERDPINVYNSDSVTIIINTTDFDSGILSALLYYQQEGNAPVVLITQLQSDVYVGVIPTQVYNQLIYYYVVIYDNQGNTISSSTFSYVVDDAIAPTIHEVVQNPVIATYTDQVIILANISDIGSGLDDVWLSYWIESTNYNVEMVITGNFYQAILPVLPYATKVVYRVTAVDLTGLRSNSTDYFYLVEDTSHPILHSVRQVPLQVIYSDIVTVYANVSDVGSGISSVYLHYTVDGGTILRDIMILNGDIYETTIAIQLYNSIINYYVEAVDKSGLTTKSLTAEYLIGDTVVPLLSSVILQDSDVDNTESPLVVVDSNDLGSGISSVVIFYNKDGGDWNSLQLMFNSNKFTGNIPVMPTGTVVEYYVEVSDNAGNSLTSPLYNYIVVEVIITSTVTETTNTSTVTSTDHTTQPTNTDTSTTQTSTTFESTSSETVTSDSTDTNTSDSPFSSAIMLIISVVGLTQLVRRLPKKTT